MAKFKTVNMPDGTVITINLDNVITLVRYGSSEPTTIKFVNGETIKVKERPVDVAS